MTPARTPNSCFLCINLLLGNRSGGVFFVNAPWIHLFQKIVCQNPYSQELFGELVMKNEPKLSHGGAGTSHNTPKTLPNGTLRPIKRAALKQPSPQKPQMDPPPAPAQPQEGAPNDPQTQECPPAPPGNDAKMDPGTFQNVAPA